MNSRATSSKMYFVLSLGYFKVVYQFFHFTVDVIFDDAEYVVHKYLPEINLSAIDVSYGKRARLNHYNHILKLFSFRFASSEDRESLIEKAKDIIFIDANPKYIFKELARFSHEKRFIFPSYTTMQDLISTATLTPELKNQLVALFYEDYIFKQKKRPLFQCIQQTVYSFIDSIESSSNSLFYPSILDQC